MTIALPAHAKINLELRILGRRADGFHDVRTVLQTIDLHDRLTFRARKGPFTMLGRWPGVPVDRTNLIWRAADLLWRVLRRPGELRDVVITLEKKIPLEAGLGGGSSDAAATLLGLVRLWQVDVMPAHLHRLAAVLGADVPFFLMGGTALGLGRGEDLYPLADVAPAWVVVVCPPFGVATADAYAWHDQEAGQGEEAPCPQMWPWTGDLSAVTVRNDFEGPVLRRFPNLAGIREKLRAAGARAVALSGSGSSIFGVFARRGPAVRATRLLAAEGRRIVLCRTVGRAEYARRLGLSHEAAE